ncbi:MAG: MarR family winged helix-turn-helix transcriptional regulator [Sarcina sp.]
MSDNSKFIQTKETIDLIHEVALFKKNYLNFMTKRLAVYNITFSEFSYLKEVVLNEGISQDLLIKNLQIDKSAVARIASSLEKKYLIERVRNSENKKFLNVFLTDEGKKYIEIIPEILEEFYAIISNNGILAEKIKSTTKGFEKINSRLVENML